MISSSHIFLEAKETRALRWRQRKQCVQIRVRCVYLFVLFFWWTNIVGCKINKIQRENIIWDKETCARELRWSYSRLNCDYGSAGRQAKCVTVAACCCEPTASAEAEKAHKSRWQKCRNKQTVPASADDGENELRTRLNKYGNYCFHYYNIFFSSSACVGSPFEAVIDDGHTTMTMT